MIVKINGNTFNVPDGSNISVINGVVTVGGDVNNSIIVSNNNLEIIVLGGLANLTVEKGSVKCDTVSGSVKAGGSVSCGIVGGSVNAGGSVSCGGVAGSVNAGGSVSMRK